MKVIRFYRERSVLQKVQKRAASRIFQNDDELLFSLKRKACKMLGDVLVRFGAKLQVYTSFSCVEVFGVGSFINFKNNRFILFSISILFLS